MFCSYLYFRDYKFDISSTGTSATFVAQSVELFYCLGHMLICEIAHRAVCYNGKLPNHILQAMGFISLWEPTKLDDCDCLQSVHENTETILVL